MLVSASERLGRNPPEIPVAGEDIDFDAQLGDEKSGQPLYLMMAALVATESGIVRALSLTRTELATEMARRELQRLSHYANNEGQRRIVMHIAAYSTLCRGISAKEAPDVVEKSIIFTGYGPMDLPILRK